MALGEEGVDLVWLIVGKVYETGELPEHMLKSIFITIPKVPGTLDCSNHCTVSLMSHLLKVLLKIRVRQELLP